MGTCCSNANDEDMDQGKYFEHSNEINAEVCYYLIPLPPSSVNDGTNGKIKAEQLTALILLLNIRNACVVAMNSTLVFLSITDTITLVISPTHLNFERAKSHVI